MVIAQRVRSVLEASAAPPRRSGCYSDLSVEPRVDSFRCELRPEPVPDARDSSDALGSSVVLVAMVIAATGPARPGRAAPGAFATPAGHSGRMRSSLTSLGPPVSRDRIITSFPKWYTPDACLQLKEHFHGQVSTTCQRRNTGTVGLRLSKVVVVGDLYVGKTSLIHRFCKNVFDRDYKATIGVDFEIERFEIAGIPYSLQIWDTAGQEKFKCIASAYYRGAQGEHPGDGLSHIWQEAPTGLITSPGPPPRHQICPPRTTEKIPSQPLGMRRLLSSQLGLGLASAVTSCRDPVLVIITAFDLTDVQTLEHTRQWLEDALRENEPGSCFVFLVGTKKDLLSGAACKQAEVEAVRLANEMQAEYWSVSAKTGENVKAFFSRVAALAFEQSVLQDLERRSSARAQERAWRTRNSACLPLRTFVVASLTLWRTSEALRSLASSSSTPLHPAHPGQAGTTQACPP
ncbi:ras-related protein Rab-36 isoform X5 [Vulpes vulpes]|uniref:Ras-related protein Rab-36 isoform X5 n=1 Tax=Vulpes vulpes TaxID=9627 RepID=A0ABM4XN17_VULVU